MCDGESSMVDLWYNIVQHSIVEIEIGIDSVV